MKYLTFKFEKIEIIEKTYESTKLKIKVNDEWYKTYITWFKKLNTEPVLSYKGTKFLFYKAHNNIFTFLPLRNYFYGVDIFINGTIGKKDEIILFESREYYDSIECTNTDHENFLCDVCDLCFEHNDGVSYYNGDSHPNTLINYEKKYNVKVDRVCEFCMDDGCISDKDIQN